MYRLFGDAEVMHFGSGVQTLEWVQDWLVGCLANDYQKWGFGKWAVVEKSHRETIGYCGLSCINIDGQLEVDIGYRLVRSAWGHGYATDAVIAVRDYSFNVICLPRLIATIDPHNLASVHVAEKAGMRYEKDVMFEGYTHPDHMFAIANPGQR